MAGIKYWDGSAWVTIPLGVPVYEQPGDPGAVPNGSIWIDTDAVVSSLGAAIVSTLPVGSVDGQECYFQSAGMAALGMAWHLRYNAASASAYKWEYIGGSALAGEANAGVNSGTNVYATPGDLTLTAPLAGDYWVEIGAMIEAALTIPWRGRASWNSTDTDCIMTSGPGGTGSPSSGASCSIALRRTLTAGQVVNPGIKSDANNTVTFSRRWVKLTPVRVG